MGDLLVARLSSLGLLAALAVIGVPAAWALLSLWDMRPGARPVSLRALRWRTDLTYLLLSPVTEVLSRVLTTVAVVWLAAAIGRGSGVQLLEGFGPVTRQPRWLVLSEMILLTDLLYYWTHRLAHTVPWLWRLHAVHHSSQQLRWISALRAHPAETYSHLIATLPLFALGFPIDATVVLAPLFTLYAMWIHADLPRVRPWRRLRWLMNSPAFHRWHHARQTHAVNFAGLLPLFDVLFGTYRLPQTAPRELGIDEPMPESWSGQLLSPFQSQRGVDAICTERPEASSNLRFAEASARVALDQNEI